MSSGQKAWAMDLEELAHEDHLARVAAFTPSQLVTIIDKMSEHLQYLEQSLPSLPSNGWYRLDELKKELAKLR